MTDADADFGTANPRGGSEEFDFREGDTVLVRARKHGTRGNIVAKFEAECTGFREGVAGSSDSAVFELPFGTMNRVTLRSYEAEFEVVE